MTIVNNDIGRDGSFLNRLRIFLKTYGDFDVSEIIPIKKNVYKVKGNHQWWIIKCYREHIKNKIWLLSNLLKDEESYVTFVPFPNEKRWLEDRQGQYWCLMPYRDGEGFSFHKEEDRFAAIQLLKQFHEKTNGNKIGHIKHKSYIEKLENRYYRFIQTKNIFTRHNHYFFFKKMDKQLQQMLRKLRRLPWDNLEYKALRRRTIIHGDCASHNFIRQSDEDIYLIDFDLVQYAPYVYEWIQLGQRFLFDGVLNVHELVKIPIFQELQKDMYFQYGLMFPGDLLREWLHFLRRAETREELVTYLRRFEEQWDKRMGNFQPQNQYDILYHYRKKEGTNHMQEKIEQLVQWLREQVKEARVNGLVVGLSGGIDSSVVAHLIQRAFPDNSLAVIMPCKSSPEDVKDAELVVKSSGIQSMTVDLTETHRVLFDAIKEQTKEWHEDQERIADANLRARLRMSTLYTIATNYRYLVVGTDNAAEWYTGYFTKYGDGGVDLVPLLHFTKGEVRELAKALGVPDEIISKPPSAGLWEGQTDENEMGTSYDKIDQYIRGEEIPEEDKVIIEGMHHRTAHKRALPKAPPKF